MVVVFVVLNGVESEESDDRDFDWKEESSLKVNDVCDVVRNNVLVPVKREWGRKE